MTINTIKSKQSESRFIDMQKTWEKAMDIDIERVFKKTDITITIYWFFLIIASILIASNFFSIILVLWFFLLIFREIIQIRKNRDKISVSLKNYLLENSKILNQSYKNIYKQQNIDEIQIFMETHKTKIKDNEEKNWDLTNQLVKKQTDLINITIIINISLIIILYSLKYNIIDILLKNICTIH